MTTRLDGPPPSFDPRSWATTAHETPAPPPAPATLRAPKPWIAGAVTAALLVAGAGISRLARTNATATPATAPANVITAALPTPPAAAPDASRRTLLIAGHGDLLRTLLSAGVPDAIARAALAAAAPTIGDAPGQLRLVLDLVGSRPPVNLTRLEATREDGAGVIVTRGAAGAAGAWRSESLASRLETRVKVVRGEMDATSFYTAAVAAGVTDSLISEFADALAFDFDFQREIRPGDVFEAAFAQQLNPEGREVGRPRLLYVSMTTQAKSRSLYRFLAPGETNASWYDGNGRSTQRALLRTPLDGARISSQFGMRRHPVLGFMKLHKGTDFAAPVGTRIHAAGDGVVVFAAMKGPNGNLTILRHDNGWLTYYLHQNRFSPGIATGVRVRQGQEIGEVGTTGRSTGPHLHYEVHINGQPVDSLTLPDSGAGRSLAAGALSAFVKERDQIDAARARSER